MEKLSLRVPTREDLFYKLNRDAWLMGVRFQLRRYRWWLLLYFVLLTGLVVLDAIDFPHGVRGVVVARKIGIWLVIMTVFYSLYILYRYYRFNRLMRSELQKHGLSYYDYTLEFDDQGITVISPDHRREGTWGYVDHYTEKDDVLHLFHGYQHFSFHAKGEMGGDAYERLKSVVVEKCKPSKIR